MQLQSILVSLDEKARASQRLAIRAIAVLICCYLIGLAFNTASGWGIAPSPTFAVLWMLTSFLALIIATVAIVRYWTIHRPKLEKGRIDLQVAMFQELQRQISELRTEIKS